MKKFRVHHILCTVLYRGSGYSGVFCENMTRKVEQLQKNPDEPLQLVAGADMICQHCPNLTSIHTCTRDRDHVSVKDRSLLEQLALNENETYTYRCFLEHAAHYITAEIFENSCGNCEWYRRKLCSYELFTENLKEMIQRFPSA